MTQNYLHTISLQQRTWLASPTQTREQRILLSIDGLSCDGIENRIRSLVEENRSIHDEQCFNLDPASNIMNPQAEAMLSAGLSTRPSLGYPGAKYETGLEAIEQIEVIASSLASQVFDARHVELRVASGAMANLYAFMATCSHGDDIIAPASAIAGHVTHHEAGCAGLYGLRTHDAPIDRDRYTVDLDALRKLAHETRPKLITIGGSLNLLPHPVADIREIADEVGAKLLFDAAHQCGLIAGGVWENPLSQGAHIMTMSTYKSLGGPPSGMILTQDEELAQRIEAIAFPGMTANFDAGKTAALAITLLDWITYGRDYARTMVDVAQSLAMELHNRGLPVYQPEDLRDTATLSHQFALHAHPWGGGQNAAAHLRRAGFLACGIGLPESSLGCDEGEPNGVRFGTPEIVRRGLRVQDTRELGQLITHALQTDAPETVAADTARFRMQFQGLHFMRNTPVPKP
ncbi:serine hydroxymethyltransferase [Orrella marina]|uniref:Serine hydroxymethyltransferase n=1 Tax=Orrella marina TaxID=2163011 RepID=A0A2R4XIM7_9BURK|nr:beta-eliminating lyase-related protein [Orrella marina]AWB33569.1 serine hydroxymethyltransferase [Orrella marina]